MITAAPFGKAAVRARAGVLVALLVAALVALSGCASAPEQGTLEDLKTSSDQTDADRRARVRMELAAGYFARGQATTALDEVKLALAARPDMPEAFNLRGLIYASMGLSLIHI